MRARLAAMNLRDRRPDPMTWVCRHCQHRNLWWKNTCEWCGRDVDDAGP